MRKVLMIFSFSSFFSFCNAQSKSELKKQQEILKEKLSGTKYAFLNLNNTQESILLNNSASKDAEILKGVIRYLKQFGFDLLVTEAQRNEAFKSAKSNCDFVKFTYSVGNYEPLMIENGMYPFSFSFTFCDNSTYGFRTKLDVTKYTEYAFESWSKSIDKFFFERKYNESGRLKISNNANVISRSSFSIYLDTSANKKPVEGIYKLFSSDANTSKYTIGIYSPNDTLKIVYFEGSGLSEDWKDGELKGYLFSTLSENDYIAKWYALDKTILDGSIIFTNKNAFEFKSNTLGYDKGIEKFIRIK